MSKVMTSYSSVTRFLLSDLPYDELALWLPYVPLSSRKALLTLCRTQSPYWQETSSRCWSRLHKDIQIRIFNPTTKRDINLIDLISNYPFESSVYSGLLSSLIRSAPLDPEEAKCAKQDAFEKELYAAITEEHPRCYEWSALLSHDYLVRATTRFHHQLPHAISVYHEVYARLSRTLYSMNEHIFMPDFSQKTLGIYLSALNTITINRSGAAATRILENCYPHVLASSEHWGTTQGLEWVYSRTGDKSCGPTELRSAWKYTDLKPRVYYARGPDQYYASRYIQEIFNFFIDSLPITNRFLRFYHAGIRISPDDTLFIYDYSSFTSRLDEVKCFLRALAGFSSGQQILLLDTYHGVVSRDLGDILKEYLEECNNFPMFDIGRFPEDCVEGDSLRMHTTGMLGVPGNITSCTLLHGIHLAIILESLIKGKCVGDDAIGAKTLERLENLQKEVEGIGEASMQKGAVWETDDCGDEDLTWNYVKRPLNRMDGRIAVGDLVTFPTIPGFFNLADGIHTFIRVDERELGKKQANALWTLCRSVDRMERSLTEEEEMIIDRFVYVFGKMASKTLHPPHRQYEFVYPRGFEVGLWKKAMTIDIWDRPVLLPRGDFGDYSHPLIVREVEEECRSNRAIALGSKLGWIVKEALYEEVIPCLNPMKFDRWLAGDLKPHYSIFVKRCCPDFLMPLLNGSLEVDVTLLADLYQVEIDELDV